MKSYWQRSIPAAPLAVFRIGLGLLLFAGVIRFWAKGWIHDLYIKPHYFFSFYGFEFIRPLGDYTYLVFAVCGIAALFVAAGLYYRLSSILLFASFTYIELIDKSTYLNHYYFISMVCLLMIFLPAQVYFSLDAYRNRRIAADEIPQWSVDILKVFVCLVYFFAGLAKINGDWLLEAQPLRMWLPARNDMPVIGPLFNYSWTAYAFSWAGCLYDLCIPFLLLNRSTRWIAFAAVIVFHALTAVLFPIGMFPYIMMVAALIFFSPNFHQQILLRAGQWLKAPNDFLLPRKKLSYRPTVCTSLMTFFGLFLAIQVVLPFRYLCYPGRLFWTEEGYRFSWRVMLMEKAGHAQFIVKDASGKQAVVDNAEFLSVLQEKMMATQPDMILQYAHMVRDYYATQGFRQPQVFVDSYVTLNGHLGKPLVDPNTDLAREVDSFHHKRWILPFENDN